MAQPRRIPLIRIGLTLVVGSVVASAFYFYIGVGQSMADLKGDTPSTSPRDLLTWFRKDFLFAGSVPSILFYLGLAIMVIGIIRNFRRESPD